MDKSKNNKKNTAEEAADNVRIINNLNKNYKEFSFNFTGKRLIFFGVVGLIFVVGMISFFVRGFNWDIDFLGGTIIEYNLHKDVDSSDTDKIYDIVEKAVGTAPSSVVKLGTDGVSVKIRTLTPEETKSVFNGVSEAYPVVVSEETHATTINPTVGKALTQNTIISVLLAVVLMLVYITFRFDFFSGLSAVLSLIFDLFVMLTFYSLLQIPMDTAVIAAFLTILGYSINATIIVFDRVRENIKLKKSSGMKFEKVINLSTCQTCARSINTTITTLITITCVFILGVPSIRNFVFPLIVGIASGCFSSLCLSGSFWLTFRGDKAMK